MVKVKVKSSMARSLKWRIYYHRMWVNYQLLTVANGELIVAVNHNQLQRMASETVDPIDWSHPYPHVQYPLSVSCIV